MKLRRFAVMWDCLGLEALAEVPDPSLKTFATLANQAAPEYPNLLMWQLRARFNSQRHYEIYIFGTDEHVTADDLRQSFNHDPQGVADLIRQKGYCFHSDRQSESNIKIR